MNDIINDDNNTISMIVELLQWIIKQIYLDDMADNEWCKCE